MRTHKLVKDNMDESLNPYYNGTYSMSKYKINNK